jgi:hypothetical protein
MEKDGKHAFTDREMVRLRDYEQKIRHSVLVALSYEKPLSDRFFA